MTCKTLGDCLPAADAAFPISCSRVSMLDLAPMAMSDAPALAKEMAMARPMPLDAPVMKTDLRAREAFVGSMAG